MTKEAVMGEAAGGKSAGASGAEDAGGVGSASVEVTRRPRAGSGCFGGLAFVLGIAAMLWAQRTVRRSEERMTIAVLEAERARRVAAVLSEAMASTTDADAGVVQSLRGVVARLDARHLRDPHLEAMIRLAVGRALMGAGALVEGEREVRWAYNERVRMYGGDHPATACAAVEWARVLCETDHAAEAEPLARRALAVCQLTRSVQHEDTIHAMHVLARSIISRPEAREEAESLLRQALDAATFLLGPESPTTRAIDGDLERLKVR